MSTASDDGRYTRRRVFAAAVLIVCCVVPMAQARQNASPLAPPNMPADASWAVRELPSGPVDVRGDVNFDKAGSDPQTFLYPAADPISLLVAIATHGAVASSLQSREKTKLQRAADQVLAPYASTLAKLDAGAMASQALQRARAGGRGRIGTTTGADRWVLETRPTFVMTQDQKALLLDNTIALFAPGDGSRPVYANSVRVVGAPQGGPDPATQWQKDEGAAMRSEIAGLYATSIDVFLQAAAAGPRAESSAKTVRYPAGGNERMERAQVVQAWCERQTLKTLRGWLMSVPVSAPASDCIPEGPAATTTATAESVQPVAQRP